MNGMLLSWDEARLREYAAIPLTASRRPRRYRPEVAWAILARVDALVPRPSRPVRVGLVCAAQWRRSWVGTHVRPGNTACYTPDLHRIALCLETNDLAGDYAHELGHHHWHTHFPRNEWQREAAGEWRWGYADGGCPEERWAEAFAYQILGREHLIPKNRLELVRRYVGRLRGEAEP